MEKIRVNKKKFIGILILLFLAVLLLNVGIGAVSISLPQMAEILFRGQQSAEQRILLYVRIPRSMAAALAGMGLAVSGAVIQTVLGNSLASPNIIGVNAGAGFAVVLCGVLFPGVYGMLPLAAFVGAFTTVVFVYLLAKYTGSSKITLVLAGVAINSLLNAATDTVYTFDPDSLVRSNGFRIGGLSGVNTSVLIPAGIAIVIAVVIAASLHNEMEVLSLGDAAAKTLGLPITFYRFLFLALAAVLAGASVSFAGLLGFVGLMVPHIARMMIGDECKYFIAASALLGGIMVMACDLMARTLFAPYELPVGIVLSFIGAPFFIWLLIHQRRKNSYD